jgi:hypothetical protein
MENMLYSDGRFFQSHLTGVLPKGVFATVRGDTVDCNQNQREMVAILRSVFGTEGSGCWSDLNKVKDEVRKEIQEEVGDQYTVLLRYGNVMRDMDLHAGQYRETQDLHTDVEAHQAPELIVFSVILPLDDKGTSIYVST